MKSIGLFEYTCPECGLGTVETTRILNYKTKIKGYPFVVDEALIGVCNHCGAESFAPQETKSWEEQFYRSLESREAFMPPIEIMELRTALGLSMEDFAKLIGCTRQSVSAWEKRDRMSPPSRMADLLMKLVRLSLRTGSIDVIPFLLDEAKKWGVIIEIRQSTAATQGTTPMILRPRLTSGGTPRQSPGRLALAARGGQNGKQGIEIETLNGDTVGTLEYDYEDGSLTLDIAGDLPPWPAIDVEIETKRGRLLTRAGVLVQGRRLVLQESSRLREHDVAQITLRPSSERGSV